MLTEEVLDVQLRRTGVLEPVQQKNLLLGSRDTCEKIEKKTVLTASLGSILYSCLRSPV